MVTLYRFAFAVLARLMLLGFGGVLVWNGVLCLKPFLDSLTRDVITTIEFTEKTTDRKIIAGFVAVALGQLVAGALLLFFGGRGLWRRLRAGLPTDEESRATTPIGRVASATIFGAGALLGVFRLGLLIVAMTNQAVLAWTGIEARAVVAEAWSGDWAPPGSDRPPTAGYQISYAFRALDRTLVHSEQRISGELFRQVEAGSVIPVTYSASDPAEHRIEFAKPLAVLLDGAIWLGLACVGIWGVRRNLGPDQPGSGPPLPRLPRAPRPDASSALSAGIQARRQFGQRTR